MLPSLVIILLLIVIYLNYNKKTDFTNQIINIALIVVVMAFTYSHLKKVQLMDNSVESENGENSNTVESFKSNNTSRENPDLSEYDDQDYLAEAEEVTVKSAPYPPVQTELSTFQSTGSLKVENLYLNQN